jgi:YbbR-like protein
VKDLLFANFGWKLLSLAGALLLWIVTAGEPELTGFVNVPVQYRNLAADLEISSTPVESVALELRGPSSVLGEFSGTPAAVVLEMSGVTEGERTFLINAASVQLPRGVQILRAIPAQLHMEFETRASRSIPVRARLSDDLAPGYRILGVKVEPDSLTVVGPESRVKQIDEAFTDPVDLSSVTQTGEFRLNAFVTDPQVRFQSDPRVKVTISLDKK